MKIQLPLLFEVVVVLLEFGLNEVNCAPFFKVITVKVNFFIELANL